MTTGVIYMIFFSYAKTPDSRGQGLVEYALVLTLVSIVVIATLILLGPTVGNVFSQVSAALSVTGTGSSIVAITRSDYDSDEGKLHLDATVDGDYSPTVTLTASPGGVLEERAGHYHRDIILSGCPCTVIVTSSTGGTASVTVGP
jgi:pilus assembly protein Flp/PilA